MTLSITESRRKGYPIMTFRSAALVVLLLFSLVAPAVAAPGDVKTAGALTITGELVSVSEQGVPTFALGSPLTARWDANTDEVTSAVTRYELRFDNGAYAAAGQPMPRASYDSPLAQGLLTVGQHSVEIRACNATGCGVGTGFAFAIQMGVPGPVPGVVVVPVGSVAAIDFNRAQEYARSFAYLFIDRYPTKTEMNALVDRHGSAPLTKDAVIATMVGAYTALKR
jgi:hypothetical protein